MTYIVLLFYLDKPHKFFDDLFGENTKKKAMPSDNDDSFKMSNSSDDDFVPKSGITF